MNIIWSLLGLFGYIFVGSFIAGFESNNTANNDKLVDVILFFWPAYYIYKFVKSVVIVPFNLGILVRENCKKGE